MGHSQQEVTQILHDLSGGEGDAANRLLPLVYDELRALAAGYLRHERSDHTLQPTALVHEAYLRMVDQTSVTWQNRSHFFGIAAQAIRRILVDHARARHALKRGGKRLRMTLNEELAGGDDPELDLLAIDDALHKLKDLSDRQCRIVELRFFSGLSVEEVAEILGVSPRTVKGDWRVARAWLKRELGRGDEEPDDA
ncbi:MAG: sigma-70 family RNA polymerase sigma factor [Phycisphaerales bacterium]|nr:sigma-70 family RNA polymerase sigma factor [Phycisphaerales bacterium]